MSGKVILLNGASSSGKLRGVADLAAPSWAESVRDDALDVARNAAG